MADDGKPFPGEVIEDHKHFAALLKWPSTNFGAGTLDRIYWRNSNAIKLGSI